MNARPGVKVRGKIVSPNIGLRSFRTDVFVALLIAFVLGGCATTWRPIPDTARIALTPSKGEITMAARPGKPIGDIVPVDIGVANGTDEPYRIEPDQIFAINGEGQRVMPIHPNQAIAEAGHTNAFKAGLVGAGKSALTGGLAGAARGAAIGAVVGLIVASPVQGAVIGAAMGGSIGATGGGIMGGFQGQAAAHNDAAQQISELSLQTRDANPNYSINGYVFFPKGNYSSVEMNLLNLETHQSATRSSSWDGVPRATWDGEPAAAPKVNSKPSVISAAPVEAESREEDSPTQERGVTVVPPARSDEQNLPTYTE
jgi:hypothetical protein